MVSNSTNTAIVIDKDAHTLSEPHTSWDAWMQQKNRHYTTAKYYKSSHKFLLSLYALAHTLIYPLTIVTAIFFNWYVAVGIFIFRLVIEAVVWNKSMKKLNEADLFGWFIFFDFWIFIYNLFFFPSLWRKPSKRWD